MNWNLHLLVKLTFKIKLLPVSSLNESDFTKNKNLANKFQFTVQSVTTKEMLVSSFSVKIQD